MPIAMHQAIQFLIADMAVKVDAARLLTWQSASQLDNGERNTLTSSEAKRFAADSAMEVTTDAVQVFGGYGFIKEYEVEKFMRDAKIMQLYEGASQIQRMVIAERFSSRATCRTLQFGVLLLKGPPPGGPFAPPFVRPGQPGTTRTTHLQSASSPRLHSEPALPLDDRTVGRALSIAASCTSSLIPCQRTAGGPC